MRVSENHLLFKIPVNAQEDIDRLIFFYGLETFGVIGPYLASKRPVLTRQAYYPIEDIPKAFYLFVSIDVFNEIELDSRNGYILSQVDSYIFAWNSNNTESRVNARGMSPIYEGEVDGRYNYFDSGRVLVHDPFHCDIDKKIRNGYHWATAEEVASGKNMLDRYFEDYEKNISSLGEYWFIANDYFTQIPGIEDYSQLGLHSNVKRFFKDSTTSYEHIAQIANNLERKVSEVCEIDYDSNFKNHSYIYEAFCINKEKVLTYKKIMEIEDFIVSLVAHGVEVHGIDMVMSNFQYRDNFLKVSDNYKVPSENVFSNELFPEIPMAYFVAGLNGDRPLSQALGFYQVLEYVSRRRCKSNNDLSCLKETIGDRDYLPDNVLKNCHYIALNDEPDEIRAIKNSGRFDRHDIANKIYSHLRNPIVHTYGKHDSDHDAIHPYDMRQFSMRFNQIVRLAREIARYFVKQSR